MKDAKVFAAASLVNLVFAVTQIPTKAALNKGMSTFIYVFYRQLIATLFMAPIALALERKKAPSLSFMVCFKVFMLALLGHVIVLNTYSIGLRYTTTTAAAAMENSVPVITFIFAVLFRIETVKIKSIRGVAKVSGLALCLVGILILAFYKGPQLKSFNHHHLFGYEISQNDGAHSHSTKRWALGTLFVTISTIALSLWMVLQGYVLTNYPAKLLLTTLQCLWSTIQSFFIALAFVRDFSQWKLELDMSLISVTVGGIMATGVSYYLSLWIIEKKGPVFLAMTTPLTLVFQIICSSFLLGETINLGSILAGVFMIGGLYSVLWGKSKEQNYSPKRENENALSEGRETTPAV